MSPSDRLDVVEDAIRNADPPVVTAPEIAAIVLEDSSVYDDVGDPRREALGDLELLERAGDVESKSTGAHSRAFWHIDRVRPPPADVDETIGSRRDIDLEPELEDDLVDEDDSSTDMSTDARKSDETDDRDDLEDVLDGWRPGRSREERLERIDAALDVLEWFREHGGTVRRADVVAETYETSAPEQQSEDAFWRKTARPAIKKAVDAGLAEIDGRAYRWLG